MKKFRNYIAVLLVMLLAVAVLVACGSWVHQHEYTKWGSNSSSHWKYCELDEAVDPATIDKHIDANNDGICDVCGYKVSTSGGNQGGGISGDEGGNQGGGSGDNGGSGNGDGNITGGDEYYNYNLSEVFKQYEDDDWNFKVIYDVYCDDATTPEYTYTFGYLDAYTMSISYDDDGEIYTDYYSYEDGIYYWDNGDGTHSTIDENSEDYEYLMYNVDVFDISTLNELAFTHFDSTSSSKASAPIIKHNQYTADDAVKAGNAILGEWLDDDIAWTCVELYLEGDHIYQIVALASGTDYAEKDVLTFSDFGEIDFDLSKLTIDNDDYDDGNDDDGGNQGGNQGGNTQTSATYTAEFTDINLNSSCAIKFSTTSTATGFDGTNKGEYNRGVQFYNPTGDVAIKTTTSLSNVTKVTLVVATNSKKGMNVSASVGNTKLTSDGNTSILVVKDGTNTATVEFVASSGVDGVVTITLAPVETGKSMWIKSVEIVCGGGSGSGSGTSTGVMPEQKYDASKHDNSTLREQMKKYYAENYYSDPLPLQSQGTYNCLVVPVEFGSYTISASQLTRLNDAFNGTSTATGWESVKTYYQQSSYGKLDMTFDIKGTYTAKESVSYYEEYKKSITIDGETFTKTGDLLLLEEVMAWLEDQIDLTKYDNDNDGVLDAIWLIYSAPVSVDDDSIYWAYVTTYGQDDKEDNKYDGLELGYYLFAGLDFMDDYTGNDNDMSYYPSDYFPEGYDKADYAIDGLVTNACTYIHETGHLLGLDDYYDYDEDNGSNVGLGGADMMDNTVGDHNAYSKLMLGWVAPTVVTTTQTVNLKPFESSGDVIMLLLDYNGTNFCEYLLIDLYTKTGLNKAHGNQYDSLLYYSEDTEIGAEYGVRIYHVSSNIDEPYSDKYYSFTTNNNSKSEEALIKLVSAYGNSYLSNEDYACDYDLFQTGDTLTSYKRNDGKTVNFTITFTSVTADGASVSITF